jgi:menaquinone-specific isochorismate synthase
LRARSFLLSTITDLPVDLNHLARGDGFLFVRDGVGFAGRGVSATANAQQARSILQRVVHETPDTPIGVGPLMFGSIPFDQSQQSEFILPTVTFCKTRTGETWVTVIDNAPIPPLVDVAPIPNNAHFEIHNGVAVETYIAAVDTARAAVRNGELTKAVIARDVFVESDTPIDIHAVLLRLRSSFGTSYRYSFDGFIGASPELLVDVHDDEITSHPLAGTTPRTGDPEQDAALAKQLLASAKNQIEHRVVIDMVHDTLLPHCSYLDWEAEPSVVQVANVQHLGTQLVGKLSEPRLHVLDAALALSPTPALGGFPRETALALIAQCEGMDRGRYGGAVGWFDQHGNGTFAVAIRCAQLNEDRTVARLFAGGGIVADSEPLDELAETQAKLQAMLAALIPEQLN